MDGAGLEEAEHARALRSLNRINRWFGVDRHLCRCLLRLFGEYDSLLDVGCGGGGFLSCLATGRHRHRPALLVGLDRSTSALRFARKKSADKVPFVAADARHIPCSDRSIDAVTCSLFLHHFDGEEVIAILREASRVARRGLVVGDLVRSRTALLLTALTVRLLTRSRIVHVDAVRSVRSAYRPDELMEMARRAGLGDAKVERRFPFRMVLTWRRSADRRP